MRAGELKNYVMIQALNQTKDAFGGMLDAWINIAPVWAAIKNLSGNERRITKEGGQVAEARTEITIRYRAGVVAKMRIVKGSTVYNIKHVNDYNEGHQMMVLTCDTGVNDGR